VTEDEWVFQIDAYLDQDKLNRVKELTQLLPEDQIPAEVKTFILRQFS